MRAEPLEGSPVEHLTVVRMDKVQSTLGMTVPKIPSDIVKESSGEKVSLDKALCNDGGCRKTFEVSAETGRLDWRAYSRPMSILNVSPLLMLRLHRTGLS